MSEDAPIYGKPTIQDVCDQVEAERRQLWHEMATLWDRADACLPDTPRCVLVTDLEAHFVAVFEDEKWINAHTGDEIDSHVTHWMELPEVPNE